MSKKQTYSYSRLTTFATCNYCYYLQYVLKLDGLQNAYSYLGGITHEQLEKLQIDEITKKEALKVFEDSLFDAEFMGYSFPSESIKDSFEASVQHYLKNFTPYECSGCEIEQQFNIDIDGVQLTGFIDLLLHNDDGTISIIDHKTSSQYSKKDKAKHGRQLVLYGIACEQQGYSVKDIGWSMLKYAKVKVGKGRYKTVMRSKIGIEFFNQIKVLMDECDLEHDLKMSTLEHLRVTGDTTCLPQEIQEQIDIQPLMVLYEYSEDNIRETREFIKNTVAEIEGKDWDDESDWQPVKIDASNNFFCNNLCGHRNRCKYLKQYNNKNKALFEREEPKVDIFADFLS